MKEQRLTKFFIAACSNHTYYGAEKPDCSSTADCCQYPNLKLNFVCLYGRCVCLLPGEIADGRKDMICCTTGSLPDPATGPCPTAKSGELCYTRNENPNINCDSGLSCTGSNPDIKTAMGSPFPEDYKICQ